MHGALILLKELLKAIDLEAMNLTILSTIGFIGHLTKDL